MAALTWISSAARVESAGGGSRRPITPSVMVEVLRAARSPMPSASPGKPTATTGSRWLNVAKVAKRASGRSMRRSRRSTARSLSASCARTHASIASPAPASSRMPTCPLSAVQETTCQLVTTCEPLPTTKPEPDSGSPSAGRHSTRTVTAFMWLVSASAQIVAAGSMNASATTIQRKHSTVTCAPRAVGARNILINEPTTYSEITSFSFLGHFKLGIQAFTLRYDYK